MRLPGSEGRVWHAWQVMFGGRACVIWGADLYIASTPAPAPRRSGMRLNGQWFTLRRAGGMALGLLRRLLDDDCPAEPPDMHASPDKPLPSLGDPNMDTETLHVTARTLLFMQDVEEQLERLARGEAVERDGPACGPYAIALPSLPSFDLARTAQMEALEGPALVVDGVVHALEVASEAEQQDADVIVRGRRLRIAHHVAKLAELAEELRARAADDPREVALREACLEVARHWRERVSRGARDARLGIVLREFVTADARFRIVARPGHLGVTLDVPPYIIHDRSDSAAYRFDACILGALVAVAAHRSLRAVPRVLWPAYYESPFTPSDEQCPAVCTGDFFAERPVAERNSHTIIDWLLCTRHILRAGFHGGGHSLNPHRDPSRWPERRVSAQELAATALPVFHFRRGE